MERLTVFDGEFWIHKNFPPVEEDRVDEFIDCVKELAARLAAIEDILGDEYDLDRLRELAQADREGRVRIIAGPKPREAVCGNCGNFIRNPGTRTGVCRVQSFYRDQHGKEEPRRGIFSPSQSRKACRKFVRAEEALRREQE